MKLELRVENVDEIWPGARRLVVEDVEDSDPEELGWYDGLSGDAVLVAVPRPEMTMLSNLYVPLRLRRRGIARWLLVEALQTVCPVLTPVYLTALPFGTQPMEQHQLRAWYEGMGFQAVEGHEFLMRLEGPEKAVF